MNVNPPALLSRYNLASNRKLCTGDDDFFEYRAWNRDPVEKHAKEIEIAERGKVHEWTTVGDNQTGLPILASSFEFFNSLAVRFPILGGIDNVRDAAWLEQFHELEPAQTEFASRLARRNLAVCKEGEDRFLTHSFLEFVLADRAFSDVDFNFKLHRKPPQTILPLEIEMRMRKPPSSSQLNKSQQARRICLKQKPPKTSSFGEALDLPWAQGVVSSNLAAPTNVNNSFICNAELRPG